MKGDLAQIEEAFGREPSLELATQDMGGFKLHLHNMKVPKDMSLSDLGASSTG